MIDSLLSDHGFAIIKHLSGALVAGGAIGLERSHHGRPAGFRTHTLVCVASSMLMLIPLYLTTWITIGGATDDVHMDPTRMAQGIMTGIGFLGAGVIYKEGISIRGLTTAASIWITAAIGILMGAGLYFPAWLATAITLCILSFFPVVERAIPRNSFLHFIIVLDKAHMMSEDQVREMIKGFGFNIGNVSYHVADGGDLVEYRMILRTADTGAPKRFAEYLAKQGTIRSFQIFPSGD